MLVETVHDRMPMTVGRWWLPVPAAALATPRQRCFSNAGGEFSPALVTTFPRSAGAIPTGPAIFQLTLATPPALLTSLNRRMRCWKARPLHALVNNAGMSPKTPYKERLGCLNGDLDAWHDVLEINFFAPLRLVRGFAAALHRARGAIVNVTSIAGHSVHPFAGSAYSISKAALSALTRELAHECGALDIRVNAVAPGEIETAMIQPEYEVLIPRIPLERMGSPEDVANAIFYPVLTGVRVRHRQRALGDGRPAPLLSGEAGLSAKRDDPRPEFCGRARSKQLRRRRQEIRARALPTEFCRSVEAENSARRQPAGRSGFRAYSDG